MAPRENVSGKRVGKRNAVAEQTVLGKRGEKRVWKAPANAGSSFFRDTNEN